MLDFPINCSCCDETDIFIQISFAGTENVLLPQSEATSSSGSDNTRLYCKPSVLLKEKQSGDNPERAGKCQQDGAAHGLITYQGNLHSVCLMLLLYDTQFLSIIKISTFLLMTKK